MFRFIILSLGLVFFSVHPLSAVAQSFNCKYAKKADEKLICSDPAIGQLDERMVEVFNELMGQAPQYLKRMLRAEQDGWLRSRHQCKWNTRCVRGHFLARTRQLNAMFAPTDRDRSDRQDREERYDRDDNYGSRRYRRNDNDGYLPKRLR